MAVTDQTGHTGQIGNFHKKQATLLHEVCQPRKYTECLLWGDHRNYNIRITFCTVDINNKIQFLDIGTHHYNTLIHICITSHTLIIQYKQTRNITVYISAYYWQKLKQNLSCVCPCILVIFYPLCLYACLCKHVWYSLI